MRHTTPHLFPSCSRLLTYFSLVHYSSLISLLFTTPHLCPSCSLLLTYFPLVHYSSLISLLFYLFPSCFELQRSLMSQSPILTYLFFV
ncbi:hypothetical protein T492DRAFT_1110699 [Pavlovales sp. CCMP2436]|nr:hypothetical protein T492DRAFT_1110699 [Pavlovales sp. CCMP2436]